MRPPTAPTTTPPPVRAGPGTLGATVWLAVAEQVRRFRRYRRRVLGGKDAEDLHQLRVALRRLRAAVTVGREAVDLPAAGDPETLLRLGKALGRLRDLDVALETIEPLIVVAKGDEAAHLGRVRSELRRMRRGTRRAIRRSLASDGVERTAKALRKWVRAPRFAPFAFRPVGAAASGLLVPQERRVREHPGWSIASSGRPFSPAEDAVLHDLRKRAKNLRYGIEILSRPDPAAAVDLLASLRDLQDTLGTLHDVETARRLVERAGARVRLEPPAIIASHLDHRSAEAQARWDRIRPGGYRGTVSTAVGAA